MRIIVIALLFCICVREVEAVGGFSLEELATLLTKEGVFSAEDTEAMMAKLREGQARREKAPPAAPKEELTLVPAAKWGQSLEEVYVSVKLAIRRDLPPCVDYEDLVFTAEGKQLELQAVCKEEPRKIIYRFNATLLWEVEPKELVKQARGEVIAVLKKKEPQWWLGLSNEGQDPPGLKVWWDVKKTFSAALSGNNAFKFGTQKKVEKMLKQQNIKLKKFNAEKASERASDPASETTSEPAPETLSESTPESVPESGFTSDPASDSTLEPASVADSISSEL